MTYQAAELERWAFEILARTGARDPAAAVTARCMVDAERRGIDTHGLTQLRQYLPRLRSGAIDGQAHPEVVVDLPGLAVVDGRNGLGAYVMDTATDVACEKAAKAGAAVVVARNSNHFGAASSFSEKAAGRGCFALVVSNSDPGLAPLGATGPVLGTNPIAIAAPRGEGIESPSLDIAASVVALGKVRAAHRLGQAIPSDWAIGPDGQPTDDPAAALEGSMLAMGGHKGFGLAFMIDVLVASIGGSNPSPSITSDVLSTDPQRVGQAIVAVDVASVRPLDEYRCEVEALARIVHGAPRTSSSAPFLIPGEKEAEVARTRGDAIPVTPERVRELESLGIDYGCPFAAAPG
jgi:LDH2 family malate/lactate/ureidoglycolate dehydrogenase